MESVYPKWLYHKELAFAGKVISSQGEFDALGDGWKETPADFDKKSDEKKGKAQGDQAEGEQGEAPIEKADFVKMTVAELKAFLLEAGVTEDKFKGLRKDELIALIGAL